jgi:hypothetical protein
VADHAAEAYFAFVVPLEPPASRRYLTLEFSWNVVTDHLTTVIGEWRAGSHVNLDLDLTLRGPPFWQEWKRYSTDDHSSARTPHGWPCCWCALTRLTVWHAEHRRSE